MSDPTAYAIPKGRQTVTIHFDRGADLEGSIFLEYSAREMSTISKVSAFLENVDSFFPVMLQESGKTEFLQKKNFRMVEMVYPDVDNDANLALMRAINVIIIFTDGISISGSLMAEVPEQKARLSDCLNLPVLFLTIKVKDKILFINKKSIQKVVHADAAA